MHASWVIGSSGIPERAERLAMNAVAVRGGDDIGPRLVNRRVDHERGAVDRVFAEDDVAVVVDEDQVAHLGVAEADRERVDPEVLGELGVANGDVPGDALAETDAAEYAQRAGQLLLAVQAFVFDRVRTSVDPRVRPASGSAAPRRWCGRFRSLSSRQVRQDGAMNRQLAPSSIAAPAANYALAMLLGQRGGVVAHQRDRAGRPDGSVPGDVGEQADVVWTNLLAILAEAEMSAVDVVSITTYVVVDQLAELPQVMAARDRCVAGASRRQHAGHSACARAPGVEARDRSGRGSVRRIGPEQSGVRSHEPWLRRTSPPRRPPTRASR